MIDFGFDKLALIGAVALIVIGPEKLPKLARTVGHLVGKAQRYVADVKAEVNRSIELEELKKMKSKFEDAARQAEQSVNQEVSAASQSISGTWQGLGADVEPTPGGASEGEGSEAGDQDWSGSALHSAIPTYSHPKKKWRLKRSAVPGWYKQRQGVRTRAQSGAARVARFRPKAVGR